MSGCYFVMLVAFLLAAWTGSSLSAQATLSPALVLFSHWVGVVFPCVFVASANAPDPLRAEVTWAIQWSFFPIYLLTLVWGQAPWSKQTKQAIIAMTKARAKGETANKRFVIIAFGMIVCGSLILSDFHVWDTFSFARGTMFAGSPTTLPILLRAQTTSTVGLIVTAWLMPLLDAGCYVMFMLELFNFMDYVELPEDDSALKP